MLHHSNIEGKEHSNNHLVMRVSNGVLHTTYIGPLRVKKNHPLEFQNQRLDFLEGEELPMLVELKNSFTFTREARVALKEINLPSTSKVAIVIKSPIHKLLANIFIKSSPNKIPVKLFKSKETALEWIKQ